MRHLKGAGRAIHCWRAERVMQVISVPEDETRNRGLTTGSAIRTMLSLTCC